MRSVTSLLVLLLLIPIAACGPSSEELRRQRQQEAFDANPDSIRGEAQLALAESRWRDAAHIAGQYALISDPTLVALGDTATEKNEAEKRAEKEALDAAEDARKEQRLLAEVRTIPASKAGKNLDLYRQLKTLNPDEQLYQQKFSHYYQIVEGKKASTKQLRLKIQRSTYAKTLENNFLDEGLNIYVTVHGSYYTTLRMKWILASRVTAHEMSKSDNFSMWRDLGFKRVELRDGYDYSVFWDLD